MSGSQAMTRTPRHCNRTSPCTLEIEGVDVKNRIYANEDVPIEDAAIEEIKSLLEVQKTADAMYIKAPELFTKKPEITQVSLSPDFHKGAGIPIGTTLATRGMVIPQAIGSDINCGVRLLKIGLSKSHITTKLTKLEPVLRRIFFEGGRNIPLTQKLRHSIITSGTMHLDVDSVYKEGGIWKYFSSLQHARDTVYTRHNGGFDTGGLHYGLEDYLDRKGVSRDSQIGSIGGGNHFVELQYVKEIYRRKTAHNLGLAKNQVVAMIHSGSVNIGHLCGRLYQTVVRELYKKLGLKFPANDIFPLPDATREYQKFWVMMYNAANFAFANRMFLGLMLRQALSEIYDDASIQARLIYDKPHNLAWKMNGEIIHRKGTSPASGTAWSTNRGFEYSCGEPVLVPGSMGAPSYVMEGQGNAEALYSACHGAGRALSRGKALKYDDDAYQRFLSNYRVVTPIDPKRKDIRERKDILKKYHESLKKEAPFAYKNTLPVIRTLQDAGIAQPVAKLHPLLTIKGN